MVYLWQKKLLKESLSQDLLFSHALLTEKSHEWYE